jgi:hypothetical protein
MLFTRYAVAVMYEHPRRVHETVVVVCDGASVDVRLADMIPQGDDPLYSRANAAVLSLDG